jgi:hypothetical protein
VNVHLGSNSGGFFKVVGLLSAADSITLAQRSRCVVLSLSWLLRTSLRYFLDDEISSLTLSALSGVWMGYRHLFFKWRVSLKMLCDLSVLRVVVPIN